MHTLEGRETHSLDNGPVDFRSGLHESPLLSSSLDVPYDDVQGVVRVIHHVAKRHQVTLARREIDVLDPLVLKLHDPSELGRPPKGHAQLVQSGQVGPQGRPVQVSLSPTL